MPYMTEASCRILVQVEGVALDALPWRTYAGGDVTSATSVTRPAGQEPAIAMPGTKERTNVTVDRMYSSDVLHPLLDSLEHAANSAKFTVSWTPIDGDGNPNGSTRVQTGILKDVTHPNFDANVGTTVVLTLVAEMNFDAAVAGN